MYGSEGGGDDWPGCDCIIFGWVGILASALGKGSLYTRLSFVHTSEGMHICTTVGINDAINDAINDGSQLVVGRQIQIFICPMNMMNRPRLLQKGKDVSLT